MLPFLQGGINGHLNLFDIAENRPRVWKTPSHLDVQYADGWETWELGCQIMLDGRLHTLIDTYIDEANEPTGVFRIGLDDSTSISRRLRTLRPPPCKLTPVYTVRKECG